MTQNNPHAFFFFKKSVFFTGVGVLHKKGQMLPLTFDSFNSRMLFLPICLLLN